MKISNVQVGPEHGFFWASIALMIGAMLFKSEPVHNIGVLFLAASYGIDLLKRMHSDEIPDLSDKVKVSDE